MMMMRRDRFSAAVELLERSAATSVKYNISKSSPFFSDDGDDGDGGARLPPLARLFDVSEC